MFDHGIDGESGDSETMMVMPAAGRSTFNSRVETRIYERARLTAVKSRRERMTAISTYWINQPVDVYLVIRQTDEMRRRTDHSLDERDSLSQGASR